jgi:hypothetical protein
MENKGGGEMKITKEWLNEQNACVDGMAWFLAQSETDGITVVKKLMMEDHFDWANWLIVRLISHEQKISYACFATRQVLGIFEKKYPDDKRPRLAIEAAEKCITENTQENRDAARAAARVAWAAGAAAWDALAAGDAAKTAWAAAKAAGDATKTAWAAAKAAWAAAKAAGTAGDAIKNKIITYGITLVAKEGEDNDDDKQESRRGDETYNR